MRGALRAGIAIYNDGYYHAAHDAWEDHWLGLEADTADERLLHGLIQFTAAVYHARNRNWEGAVGLAESAGEYLEGLPASYCDVAVAPVRDFLATLATDPEMIERRQPLSLEFDGEALSLETLDMDATLVAAGVLAEELGYDEAVLERGAEYARSDLAEGNETSQFLALVVDFVREANQRPLIVDRLEAHVERRQTRERDVEGLFDT
ncbi:DUF309 domain-containing protein [Halobacteria archaeon AArc-curdl1]|uniref:DUF309 domain-containing protein n=1 Tax=Natronosalvus hydrolyticus TaxID=2979988 RepID=A0AAP2Z834_9EURY|nr:DUF309 domain-containing protein [Halobacteria archaeon AArc-curdl1]